MFNEYIESIKEEIINSTCELIRIPSVNSLSNNAQEPFGENCAKALDYILSLGENLGFRTKNIDGYCGYIEFGEGPELMGIIGHLDVVPEGENWTNPPFSATIKDGKIYGRGAIDDKGPVIASLYAMKTVADTCKINKRVRLILGLNEENDWKCINYYKAHEEIPEFGFSPDADFPCIYAEKSLLNVHLNEQYLSNNSITIKNIDYGNNAINVVPKFCEVTLEIDNNISVSNCIASLEKIIEQYSYSIKVSKKENNLITIASYGTSSHAAHPDLGINAISHIIIVLYDFFKLYNIDIELLSFFRKHIHTQYNGEDLNIDYFDESGKLTLNVAKFYLENGFLTISMNLRIPVHTEIKTIEEKFETLLANSNINVNFDGEKDALYIPKDNKIVSTLCTIFNKVTNQNKEPIAIGGATYARAFPNCVSFGANMPNDEDMCHKVDEFISIDNLILSCKIYAEAIYELAK